jgi:hypothetical protein
MPRDGARAVEIEQREEFQSLRAPVLAVGLGRGGGGKSTVLSEMVWRAKSQGRQVVVADGDARSKTLSGLFPGAIAPVGEEMPDVKQFLTGLLNRMVKEKTSAVLDLGGGDTALKEFGRELRLVEFCKRRGIQPLAVYCLGPEEEDLSHVHTIFEGEYFRPDRAILVTNEGVIRSGQHVAGAFERTLTDPRFAAIVASGAKPILLPRLACMPIVKTSVAGFYGAAAGEAGLDAVEQFMVEDWCAGLEEKRAEAGISDWLP